MQRKCFAGLLTATLMVGSALPAFAADAPVAGDADDTFQVTQARKQTVKTQEASDEDVGELRAVLSGVSSLVIPGLGQWVFNQEPTKGVMHFVGAVVLWAIPSIVPMPSPVDRLYMVIPTLFHFYSGYDAYRGAGGKVKVVSQPGLEAWSFDSQVAGFGAEQPLGHMALASYQLLD